MSATPKRARAVPARAAAAQARAAAPALDYTLIAILATLVALGLVEVFSASFVTVGLKFFSTQIVWVGIGIVVLGVVAVVPYDVWRRAAVPMMAVMLVLLVAVLLFGGELYGAKRTLFGGRLQPSELAKLAVVIYAAAWVASKKKNLRDLRAGLIPFAIVMGVVAGLVVLEKSVSVTIIILITGISIFFLGGGDLKQLLITGLITAVVLVLLVYQFRYGVPRIEAWWTAVTNPDNAPYDIWKVMEMIRRGGGIGTRPDNWLMKGNVPLLWSDYLFANLAADLHFPGAMLVVVLFAALGYRGLTIALNAPDSFGALTAIGVTTWILAQAIIHMGTSVALIPATGIPLPFMSYGGSAMISCMAGMGLLFSISRASPEKRAAYESFAFGWRNRRPRLPDTRSGERSARAVEEAPARSFDRPKPRRRGGLAGRIRRAIGRKGGKRRKAAAPERNRRPVRR